MSYDYNSTTSRNSSVGLLSAGAQPASLQGRAEHRDVRRLLSADATVRCDLRKLTFIDAYGLVGTACALQASGARQALALRLPDASTTRSHLSAMGFRDFLSTFSSSVGLPATAAIDAPDVVVPLQCTSDSRGGQALSNLLWEQLRDHVDPAVLHAMTEGVGEMVENALEHSGEDALIRGQVYRTPRGTPPDHNDRVQVVIGDTVAESNGPSSTRGATRRRRTSKRSSWLWSTSCRRSPIRLGARACTRRWSKCSKRKGA